MLKFKRLVLSIAAVILFSGVALAAPVSAKDGSSDTTTSDSTSDTSQSGTLSEQFREMAKEKVQQAKENHSEQTEAQRQKVCEVRSKNLDHRMATAVKVA